MSDDKRVSPLERFRNRGMSGNGTTPPPASPPRSATVHEFSNKVPYQAAPAHPTDRAIRLRVNYTSGESDGISYSYIPRIFSPNANLLVLIYTGEPEPAGIVITGENLSAILKQLDEERATSLEIFDAQRHDEPEEGAAIIREIGYQQTSNQPEPEAK